MTIFHWVHIVAGVWLAFSNFIPFLGQNMLLANNVIIGVVVTLYNAFYLFYKSNTDVKDAV